MSKLSSILNKGRQVVDLTKMGVKIEKEEKNIEKLYANLGRVFYKIHKDPPEVMYEDLFRTIAGSERQLEYLKSETHMINGKRNCQMCSNSLRKTDLYCALCGNDVKEN